MARMTDLASLPPSVLLKIAQLEQHCLTLTTTLEASRKELQRLRIEQRDLAPRTVYDEFGANRESERLIAENLRLETAIKAQIAHGEALERRLRGEEAVIRSCKAFLHDLPDGVRLRVVEGRPGDLDDIRRRIGEVRDEIGKVQRTPVPSADIAERVKRHVDALAARAAPIITGVGSGQALRVLFPLSLHADRIAQSGFAPDQANALLLVALLEPERLTERLMEVIADTSIAASERDGRLRTLQAELAQLHYDEEASISAMTERGEDVTRSTSAPAWSVLMVEIEQQQRAAA